MPKDQNTAAKRARAAARQGAKYTEALRAVRGDDEHQDDGDGGRLAEIVRRWNQANDAAGAAEEGEPGQPYDPYAVAAAVQARAHLFGELAGELADAARRGEPVTLSPEIVRVLAIAAERGELADASAAARHRVEWAIPTITPNAEVAKLMLIRCEGCGQYWRPNNTAYCTQCPRIYHGPTPRTRAEAAELPKTLLTYDPETGELTARR